MAQFYKPSQNKQSSRVKSLSAKPLTQTLTITKHDHSGNGLCLQTKPLTVVGNALLGEEVLVRIDKASKKVNIGEAIEIIKPHPKRQAPFCKLYKQCGGCSMQHTSADFSLEQKDQALQSFINQTKCASEAAWQPAIRSDIDYSSASGNGVGYRRRVRLAIDARNPAAIKIGYRERNSSRIINVDYCPVALEPINQQLAAISSMLRQLPSINNLGHIVITFGEHMISTNLASDSTETKSNVQLALFMTKPMSAKSKQILKTFALERAIAIVIYTKNAPPILLNTDSAELGMRISHELIQGISAEQFVQVNACVNQRMLETAINWLTPSSTDVLYDFFCGAGNFSLAFAKRVQKVVGYEGLSAMVQSAANNSAINQIDNCEFITADLSNQEQLANIEIKRDSLVVLDPSREGAQALSERLVKAKVSKILYVSCKPSSFARDLKILSERYKVEKIASIDMFPFTQHIEMMALLSIK